MPSALDVIRVIAELAQAGEVALNIYHALSTENTNDEDFKDDVAARLEEAYTLIDAAQAPDTSYVSIKFFNVTANEDLGEMAWPTLTVGSSGGDLLPHGTAGLITMPTAIPGTRGRKFIPGLSEAGLVDGLFLSELMDNLAALGAVIIDEFIGGSTGAPIAFGVIDKLGVFRTFVGASSTNVPAYQRRRKPGVGA